MIRKLILFIFLLAIAAAGYLAFQVLSPMPPTRKEVFLDIPSGMNTRAMARLLHQSGVIRSETAFLLVRGLRRGAVLQAGEYRFADPAAAWTVFDRIVRGDIYYHELRVPEGSNIFDIGETLEKMGLIGKKAFLEAVRDTTPIRDLAPAAPSLEGYLFPATYRITKHTTAPQVCRQMTDMFRKVWKQSGMPESDVHRVVTLASLVEKETGVPTERRLVASVYQNRLDRGIKLDCDPTTIYAALLEGRYRGTIYRSDLDNPHPYNTYRNPGLPPGPIANPGRESILAALSPAETDFIFFVAKPDGSGGHNFSATMSEHEAAVRAYREAH